MIVRWDTQLLPGLWMPVADEDVMETVTAIQNLGWPVKVEME